MDYNIEFAHIYADKKFGSEQKVSVDICKRELNRIKGLGFSYCTCVMIDEFSPKQKPLLDKKAEFVKQIVRQGVEIDFIAYESKLQDLAIKLVDKIPKSKLQVEKFKNGNSLLLITDDSKIGLIKNGLPTCSLLIATWYLCRLGNLKIPTGLIPDKFSKKKFIARKALTILPEKYLQSETKALKILSFAGFKGIDKQIEHYFF